MSNSHSNLGFAEFLLASEEDATLVGRDPSWIAAFDAALDEWIAEAADRPEEKRAEAAARIATCRDHNLSRLDLSRMGLSSLPDCLGDLQQLEWLVLVSNNLTALPDWVCKLRDLTGLYLSFNRLETLPAALGELSRLEKLRLDNNHLEHLPESIGDLRQLTQLSFGQNRIECLPDGVWLLPSLDAETIYTLPRMEQENRIAFLEHRAKNLSVMLAETQRTEEGVIAAAHPVPDPDIDQTPVPSQGLMGLLALQRVQIASAVSEVRDEINSLRIDLAVQDAELG